MGEVAGPTPPATTIGGRSLKYAAWGDGHNASHLIEADGDGDGDGDSDGFTVWYGRDGVLVGVLTHGRDDDLERGRDLVHQSEAYRARAATQSSG